MRKQDRIDWMDGLKGIACILIFVHHFLLMFYPAVHYGEAVPTKCRGLDIYLSQSPLSVIVNGNFLVALFCIISGIVISLQIMTMEDKNQLADIVLKRYLRLMLPVIPVGLCVYVMLRTGLFQHWEVVNHTQSPWVTHFYQEPISFVQTIRIVLVDIWFWGNDRLSTAFWMLADLFYGTFWSIALSTVCWKYPRRTWIIYVLAAMALYGHGTIRLAFVLGTFLAWIYLRCPQYFRKTWGLAALGIGIFLGGYPSGVVPDNLYRYLGAANYYIDIHILGAFLTLYGIWSLKILQKLLSTSICRNLGMISYSVYLIHIPLLFSFSAWLFLIARDKMPYLYSAILSLSASLILLMAVANMYYRFVEKKAVRLQKKMLNWLYRQNTQPTKQENL